MTGQELETFFKSFGVPLVNIIDQWEGVPSILLDNYQSMRELVAHLIVQHGFKRIFFIRGPQDHSYANERYQAFCDIMTEHGLFIEELVSRPTDWKPNRQASFQELIGELRPGRDFEAIVSSNDDWAIEAINRMNDWGIEVPGEVAVVGFNNTSRGQSAIPSLTSSGPSFFEQGKKTVDLLYQLIQGNKVSEQIKLPCKLYIRQSCGCLDLSNITNDPLEIAGLLISDWDETMLANHLCQIFENNKMDSAIKYVNALIKALNDYLKGGSPFEFFRVLNKVITTSVDIDKALTVWNEAEVIVRKWSNQNFPPANQEQREFFWNQVHNLLRNIFAQIKEKAANQQKEL
ncbi:MAG TPA: substrate-binding domain-containing protein, partial [Bacillota bacterium]|nr:substrate-binding domain-containing protein [Bacillota bacterium]